MTKVLKFQTDDENINFKAFEYNTSCLIEDMLKDFLKKTNSYILIFLYIFTL